MLPSVTRPTYGCAAPSKVPFKTALAEPANARAATQRSPQRRRIGGSIVSTGVEAHASKG
jgi:hypothetical protein